jgi:hypothetical protein
MQHPSRLFRSIPYQLSISILQKHSVIALHRRCKLPGGFLANRPFTMLHFADMTARNAGHLGKPHLGKLFLNA